jgi:hypothetical protein
MAEQEDIGAVVVRGEITTAEYASQSAGTPMRDGVDSTDDGRSRAINLDSQLAKLAACVEYG